MIIQANLKTDDLVLMKYACPREKKVQRFVDELNKGAVFPR
jgi:hypothetical protein